MPGGQLLGPTYDYTHRLLDFSLLDTPTSNGTATSGQGETEPTAHQVDPLHHDGIPASNGTAMSSNGVPTPAEAVPVPRVVDLLNREGLTETSEPCDDQPVGDLTRQPLLFPAPRDVRLQNLARGDEGFILALGLPRSAVWQYHPFAGEVRMGVVVIEPPELGFPIDIGDITVTE